MLISTYALLLASPWLVRRFLEGRVTPRALVWSYLGSLAAVGTATVLLLVSLFLRYLPHDFLGRAGLVCKVTTACQRMLPLWANATVSFLLGGIVLGLGLFAILSVVGMTRSSLRECHTLRRCDLDDRALLLGRRGRPLLVIEDVRPLSYTVGFLRPRAVISTGLLGALDDEEVEAVLAHEEAHIRGRDNILVLVARTLSLTFGLIPGVRLAYRRLRRAQELAADDFARRTTGDGLVVASSLQKFARALCRPTAGPAAALGFADEGDVTERIRGLLFGEVIQSSRRRLATAAIGLALLLSVFTGSALAFTSVTVAAVPASAGADCSHAPAAGVVHPH